jgi:hypothetical protein
MKDWKRGCVDGGDVAGGDCGIGRLTGLLRARRGCGLRAALRRLSVTIAQAATAASSQLGLVILFPFSPPQHLSAGQMGTGSKQQRQNAWRCCVTP